MSLTESKISRRDFLKVTAAAAGMLLLPKDVEANIARTRLAGAAALDNFPDAEFIGRNCSGGILNFRSRPSAEAPIVKIVYEDALFPIYREVIGEAPGGTPIATWYETPYGYAFSPNVQEVKNEPNELETDLPQTSMGRGFWAEITVPYVGLNFDGDPISPWYQSIYDHNPRVYYGQVFWVDDIRTSYDGTVLYRANELYGTYGDKVYADGRGFRRIREEDVSQIHPDAQEKRILANLTYQTLTCFEGKDEVYFCRMSSGRVYGDDGQVTDNYATPAGNHSPHRKLISLHMAGAMTGGGWDTPGVPWNFMFAPGGAAIHGVFWHASFGVARSHGCINCRNEDAKWIYRWTDPYVPLDPGDMDIVAAGLQGTKVEVVN